MNCYRFKIPKINHMLLYPDYPDILKHLDRNRRMFKSLSELSKKRAILRDELNLDSKKPVIVTGHQEIFFHPGIWIKDFLISKIARDIDGVAIHLVVDSDWVDEIGVYTPTKVDDNIKKKWISLKKIEEQKPLEFADVSSFEIERFISKILNHLNISEISKVIELSRTYFKFLKEEAENDRIFPNILLKSRKRFERQISANLNYQSIYISDIIKTDTFKKFFNYLTKDVVQLREIFNRTLFDYRKIYKTKNPVEPFCDLDEREVPFWQIDGKFRRRYFHNNGKIDYSSLRPKGAILTLFIRLFLADYFIHGIGGARYAGFSDLFIKRYFNLKPPAFGVVSLSYGLKSTKELSYKKAKLHCLKLKKRGIEFNPEKFKDKVKNFNKFNAFVDEKKSLIGKLNQNGEKRTLNKKIKELNKKMSNYLTPICEEIQIDIKKLEKEIKENEIYIFRKYPFFFFTGKDINEFLNGV